MNPDVASRLQSAPRPLDEVFEIRLNMRSDWHVGSGAGRPGSVDKLVRRDADDLPYVPAKTLTGIWRDACERVATGLDDGDAQGVWNQWVNYLFGDQPAIKNAKTIRSAARQTESHSLDHDWRAPRQAAISLRSAHLPSELRQALNTKLVAREAVTFVKPGIAIHPQTGSSRPDYLRFEEMARGGISLLANCELRYLEESHRRIASALLIAGARIVERLGGKRRRGAGRCELTIAGFDQIDQWLDWIETHPRPDKPPPPDSAPEQITIPDNVAHAEGEWLCLDLHLTSKLPVIIPAGIVGNLIETRDYVPGTYLLPHITRSLSGINANAAIARGDLIVTNATIELAGARGRSAPFSLAYPKTKRGLKDGRDVFNQLCEHGPDEQLKNHREGYVGPTVNSKPLGSLPIFETIDPVVETHNVVDDDVQRPTEDVGGVYSYQALPAGTALRTELRLRRSLCDELSAKDPRWFSKLHGYLNLGRANKDDYGVVELRASGPPVPQSRAIIDDTKELTVWLLSDLLLRNRRLRPVASVKCLAEVLEEKLNDGIEEAKKIRLTVRSQEQAGDLWSNLPRQRRTDSWHVGWGLPRPSLAGLQAGTCAVLKVEGEIDQARLTEIEGGGIGERRAEGYGQICFNDPLLRSPLKALRRQKQADVKRNGDAFFVTRESSFPYARLIESEAVRNELRRLAPGFAAERENRKTALGIDIENKQSKPRMSQLGALGSTVRRLRQVGDEPHVLEWLNHLATSVSRRKEWSDDRRACVEELITDRERVWQLLKLDFAELVLTENGEAELKEELWAEAVRALVDACVRAHKRDWEGERHG